MGFSGGGSNILKSHRHDGLVVQDGGSLDFNNITQSNSSAGQIFYSDGVHLQQLAYPGVPAGEALTAVAASTEPSWVSGSSGLWIANGTATAATLQSELAVTGISNTPDIVQILYNVCGDNATTSILGLRLNNVSTSTYNSRVMGFYNAFDYDDRTSKSEWWVDRGTPNHSRVGEILLFKANPNFSAGSAAGDVGWCWRNSSSESQGGAAQSPTYITMSGGSNVSLTSDLTSVQMLFEAGDILGNIQVNSMTYQ